MCGIFGIHVVGLNAASSDSVRAAMTDLFLRSESRGKEASGLIIRTNSHVYILKSAVRAKHFVRHKSYREAIDTVVKEALISQSPVTLIGHSRLVTNGVEENNLNNQPVSYGATICVHNGIVVNDEALWTEEPALTRYSEIDSEVICALIDQNVTTNGLQAAVAGTMSRLDGAASIAVVDRRVGAFALTTNTGSIYYYGREKHGLAFASERYILTLFKEKLRGFPAPGSEIHQLRPGSQLSCDYSSAAVNVADNDARFEQAVSASEGAVLPCTELPEIPLPGGHKSMRTLSSVRNRVVPEDIEQAYQRREAEVAQLRRCSRCVLPETMPFIEFDSDGVCSICRSYTPISVAGPEKLQELADRHRSRDGSPDCIAAISGGRDSTYGLHYLKRELGLNPIAYTYDWGMVTDLARRNQARITGKLGVEHIIISADIQTKRRNIANNVLAWLKRPDLGMIPLFMAGDKQFYYYANVVRKQTGVPLLFFSAGNEIEATGFKTGFCGIRQGPEQGLLSSMTLANKLRLIAHYGKGFALNPAYISRSLVDTAHAFFSSYVMKHDYHYLFHYLYWDEEQIMDVLMNEYDWQVATDTSATWRIGDGTAAFYNYIYYMVAGLTENDTFRSNQVREGKMDRDTAIALSQEENHPRYDTIQEYLDLIGVEFEPTLRTIAAITPLEQR